MESVLLQFRHEGPAPSLDQVRELFDLQPGDVDPQFGVIATDPVEGIFTVLVSAQATRRVEARLATRPRHAAEGLFANPPIEPFGPPEPR